MTVTVIGAGLAGCEAAWQLANAGIVNRVFEDIALKNPKKTILYAEDGQLTFDELNRKANKMKQGELAKKLEGYDIFVKQNTVSAWESGSTQPSARQLLAICELLVFHPLINSTF